MTTEPLSPERLDELARAVVCPVCGMSGVSPCRVLSHRDERERPDHKARIKLEAAALRARAKEANDGNE